MGLGKVLQALIIQGIMGKFMEAKRLHNPIIKIAITVQSSTVMATLYSIIPIH
jgi:hypothetical protein